MTLPSFNAETSLYKTTVHYGLTGGSVPSGGVMPQLFSHCGGCYLNTAGSCVQFCIFCEGFPPHCSTAIVACDPSACQGQNCCKPGFKCCGECLHGTCVADPFSNQGCVPLGVRCK